MKQGLKLLTAMLLALTVASCAIIPEPEQVSTYRLPPGEQLTQVDSASDPIRVSRPLVTDLLGTNRILRLSENGEFSAYSGVRWSANVPVLWRDWMVDSLMRSGFPVSADVENIHTQYELGTTLRAFHIETSGSELQARVTLDARLVHNQSRKVIDSYRFDITAPVSSNSPQEAVQALGQASSELSEELSRWLAAQAG